MYFILIDNKSNYEIVMKFSQLNKVEFSTRKTDKLIVLFCCFLSFALATEAQDAKTLNSIQDSIIKQLALFPQEKIHLHTDRTVYVPGEKIWFKVYVVDAVSNQSPTPSQYAYVELINSSDSLVHRVMVSRDENGLFHGLLFLSELIPKGDYTLRAYTRYMENLGDDYFFKKNIRIDNINKIEGVNLVSALNDYDVSFFPEGGYLTESALSRVAFKAMNQNGVSQYITGELIDMDGNRITDVSTVFAGMGSFSFFPQAGKAYFLVCRNKGGLEKRFQLPPAQKNGAIRAYSLNNNHVIQITKSPDYVEKSLYLLVHYKGAVLYFDLWDHRSEAMTFPSKDFPSGVLQFVLFDEQLKPISERLIFNKNDDQDRLIFSLDKLYYQKREKITAEIQVTDPDGNPMAGHVSVAVTDDKDVAIDTLHTIMASLLLSSELKGDIESPGYYLQNHRKSEIALDHLMLTHGWRRYEIAEVIKGHYSLPETNFEESKKLSGLVKSLVMKKPVANSVVSFFSNYGIFGQTITDSEGFFSIDVHYPDSVQFFVQAFNQKGREGVELVPHREKFPKLKHAPVTLSDLNVIKNNENHFFDFLKKAEQRSRYDEDMKFVQLSEVTVSARKTDKKDEVRLKNFAVGGDHVIYREEIEKRNPLHITDMLRTVTGVKVLSNGVISIRNAGPPLVLIDGIQIEWPSKMTSAFDSPIETVSALDVESIDVFVGGGKTAIFGPRGVNGVISITTRRGENSPVIPSPNYTSFSPLGFQKPVEFYNPKYDTPTLKNLSIPDYRTTIFWKPDIIVLEDGKASFDFYSSDFTTTYSVVIEGLTNAGQIIRQVEKIEIK